MTPVTLPICPEDALITSMVRINRAMVSSLLCVVSIDDSQEKEGIHANSAGQGCLFHFRLSAWLSGIQGDVLPSESEPDRTAFFLPQRGKNRNAA